MPTQIYNLQQHHQMYPAEFEWTINLETLDQDYKPHSNLGFSSVSDMLQTFMGLSGYGMAQKLDVSADSSRQKSWETDRRKRRFKSDKTIVWTGLRLSGMLTQLATR